GRTALLSRPHCSPTTSGRLWRAVLRHQLPCRGNTHLQTPHYYFSEYPDQESCPMSRTVEVTELALRDGHQSLLATRMALEDMTPVCEDIDRAGYWSVECWGGATYDACIRFLNEDPWERLRTFRKILPNSRLQMLLRGQNLLGYRHYEDTVDDRFVVHSAENGMDVFRVFDALSDIRNLRRALQAVPRTGKHAQGTICYTFPPLHTIH